MNRNIDFAAANPGVTVSRATLADIDTILEWRMKVIEEVFHLDSGHDYEQLALLKAANRDYLYRKMLSNDYEACLVHSGTQIIGCGGMVIYQELPSPENPSGTCCYLTNIYIEPRQRHHGVGGELVKWLVDRAHTRGINKIFLESTLETLDFYKSLGFEGLQDMLMLVNK